MNEPTGKPRALNGIRILDLTRVWAGPLGTRILGDLGAEVIKIEHLTARGMGMDFDMTQQVTHLMKGWKPGRLPHPIVRSGMFPNGDPGEHPWNRQGLFNKMNRNKLGLTLDLAKPAGVRVFKALVKMSHAVIENYSPRVMKNLGIDYPVLKDLNPAIVFVSMPGFGTTGPYRDYVSYGPILEGASGLASLSGYPGAGPRKFGVAYADPIGGLNAAFAILLGVWHARSSGEGQFIDLSQCEALTCTIGEAVLGFQLTDEAPVQMGNRHPWMAPHGCYRCKGDDRWVTIAVSSDTQWEKLCEVMGNPSWARDDRFTGQLGRWKHQEELDSLIEKWTLEHDHQQIMERLQSAGVAAGAVLDSAEILQDPHLAERGFFVTITQPEAGTHPYPGLPIRLSKDPALTWRPCPCLGEHNEYVLGELLGMSAEEIAELQKEGVIGNRPPPM